VGYGKTERLEKILSGVIVPTQRDVRELWSVLKSSTGYTGYDVTIKDFSVWISEGCEVLW
jgi:hypothetical protein